MRAIGFLFGAACALTVLTGCVGSDSQSRLPSGAAGVAAASSIPLAAPSNAPVEEANVVGVMPGDLLIAPRRDSATTDPGTVLARPVRLTEATPHRAVAARARASSPAAAPPPGVEPTQSTTFAMTPTSGTAPAPGSAGLAALRPRMAPLADVEAQAAVEQRAQEQRDRRFDAQVRRASASICSGCASGPERTPSRRTRPRPDPEE